MPEEAEGFVVCSDRVIAFESDEDPDEQGDCGEGHYGKEYVCVKEPTTMQPAQEGAEVPSEFPRVMEFHAAILLS